MTTESAVDDPIVDQLVAARMKLTHDFKETIETSEAVRQLRIVGGEEMYQEFLSRWQKEHDDTLAMIDERINNRRRQLAGIENPYQ